MTQQYGMIYIASDHAGFARKHALVVALRQAGWTVTDLGPQELVSADDYPAYAFAVAERVAADAASRGILLCANGVGMTIAANKVPRIRAGLAWSTDVARSMREDDDANVLCVPAKHRDDAEVLEITTTWLDTPFSGVERHVRRIGQIRQYEEQRG